MENELRISGSVTINAPAGKVWDVLVNPTKIELYTGSKTSTDWKVGGKISWTGNMGGFNYENKGVVLENTTDKVLKFTFWTGIGGDADLPENYSTVTYTLEPSGPSTVLTYTRERIATASEKEMFDGHLQYMLNEIKRIAEQ